MKKRIARKVLGNVRNGRSIRLNTLAEAIKALPVNNVGEFVRVYGSYRYSGATEYRIGDGLTLVIQYKGYNKLVKLNYECLAGSSIKWAIPKMGEYANAWRRTLSDNFNGVEVVAVPGCNPLSLYKFWQDESERKYQEYLNSDEYKQYLKERAEELVRDQAIIDDLIAKLPAVVATANLDQILDWIDSFCLIADDSGIVYDREFVASEMSKVWVQNAHVVDKEKATCGVCLREDSLYPSDAGMICHICYKELYGKAALNRVIFGVEHNKQFFGEWIVGQAIECLRNAPGIHPISQKFIAEYRQLPPDGEEGDLPDEPLPEDSDELDELDLEESLEKALVLIEAVDQWEEDESDEPSFPEALMLA